MTAHDLLGHESPICTTFQHPGTAAPGGHEHDVLQAARTGACVLFTAWPNAKGVALSIHSLSGWRWGPFVSIDCGASETALECQLFGLLAQEPEDGAGSEPTPRLAQNGTIFLYEVGRLGLRLQRRLAEALAAGTAGDVRPRPRARVIASTSTSLFDRVLSGTFDDRLFYRLNSIHFASVNAGADSQES